MTHYPETQPGPSSLSLKVPNAPLPVHAHSSPCHLSRPLRLPNPIHSPHTAFAQTYCVLSIAILLLSPAASYPASQQQDKPVTTDQIVSFLFSKAFGFKTVLSDAKTSFSARQALWQQGDEDSTDYIYRDRSNTRLEVRLDVPIFDLSYYRDRSKEKRECQAFIMKSLSKILAAQKSVNTLEARVSVLNSRHKYLHGQVKLSLANKTALFTVEDQLLSTQSQLYEAQSTLEQRIIDLAILAGNHWEEAYDMIIKWDGKLFEKSSS